MPNIKPWCRWRSTEAARGYAECLDEGTIQLVAEWPRAPNPLSKDMYACKASKLEVRDVDLVAPFRHESPTVYSPPPPLVFAPHDDQGTEVRFSGYAPAMSRETNNVTELWAALEALQSFGTPNWPS